MNVGKPLAGLIRRSKNLRQLPSSVKQRFEQGKEGFFRTSPAATQKSENTAKRSGKSNKKTASKFNFSQLISSRSANKEVESGRLSSRLKIKLRRSNRVSDNTNTVSSFTVRSPKTEPKNPVLPENQIVNVSSVRLNKFREDLPKTPE